MTGNLFSLALRSTVAGAAALAISLAFISLGTPARSYDPGPRGARLTGMIYSDIGQYRAPLRLASLETDFTTDEPAADDEQQETAAMAAEDGASFTTRFNSSFGERLSSFEERFDGMRQTAPQPMHPPTALALATLEPGLDGLLAPETPKRQNAQVAALAPAASATAAIRASVPIPPSKPIRTADARSDSMLPEAAGNRTAVYDITARVVYLPNGEKLEAHSGLGGLMDDPRTVAMKNRGVTPPNVYELSLRERPFHGVRAIRLTPVDPDKMYGREGILAHPYMLGANGESNGCVSISDYPKFLNAFLNGDVDRLVVVERLADPPSTTGAAWLAERIKAFFKSS